MINTKKNKLGRCSVIFFLLPSNVLPLLAATHSPLTNALSYTKELAALNPGLGGVTLSMIVDRDENERSFGDNLNIAAATARVG